MGELSRQLLAGRLEESEFVSCFHTLVRPATPRAAQSCCPPSDQSYVGRMSHRFGAFQFGGPNEASHRALTTMAARIPRKAGDRTASMAELLCRWSPPRTLA